MTINIGGRQVGGQNPPLVIAEIAQAHDGSLGIAHAFPAARTGERGAVPETQRVGAPILPGPGGEEDGCRDGAARGWLAPHPESPTLPTTPAVGIDRAINGDRPRTRLALPPGSAQSSTWLRPRFRLRLTRRKHQTRPGTINGLSWVSK